MLKNSFLEEFFKVLNIKNAGANYFDKEVVVDKIKHKPKFLTFH